MYFENLNAETKALIDHGSKKKIATAQEEDEL